MSNKVLLKKSSVAAKVPLTTDLDYGEIALNYADGKLYYKTSGNAIDYFDSAIATATLTNKTLTSPTINSGALSGTFSGVLNLSDTTASTSTTTGAVKIAGGLGVAGSIYADQIRLTNNGNGTNVYIGDDVYIGDINVANTLGVRGIQDATKGYIVFGNSNGTAYIGRDGTNPITVYGGQFTVSGTATGSSAIMLQLNGYTNKGGTGYHDFLSVTNTYGSATNPNKFFRLNNTGNLEIINSAYTTNIFTLTDAGVLTVPQINASNGVGTSGQVLSSTGTGLQWVTVSGTGTVTSITAGTGLTGGTITTSGTIAIDSTVVTLSGTQTLTNKTLTLPVIDNPKLGYTTTATAAGTTTLTSASNYRQLFTGTTTQTVVMPVTSTLSLGWAVEIENNSTGNVTVNSSGGNLIGTIYPGTAVHLLCTGTTLTTAADWDFDYISFSAVTGTGSAVLSASPTFTGTASFTSISASGGTITLNAGTSNTTSIATAATTGTINIGGSSQTGAIKIGPSTSGQTIDIGYGAIASGITKTINIGRLGASGSTTYIELGSSVSGALGNITLNQDTITRGNITQASGATTVANQSVTQAIVATTAQTAVDTFAIATYRSAKYVVQITQGTNYQISEVLVIHNGTTTTMTEYGMMNTGGVLGTFATDISTTNARLLVTMAAATSATINITRTTIVV